MRVRFAPSPTGALHIGGARTALYNWLLARGNEGTLVLRIEDTDRERSTPENVAQILEALEWLGIDYDEGPISQVARSDRHGEVLRRLLDAGRAYRSTATGDDVKAYKAQHGADRGFRGDDEGEGAVRLRVPDEGATVVHDVIRGDTTFQHVHLDDPVIARADGSVLYNFAVAVDDLDAHITHIVRGEDHLSNTPKQLLVLEAMAATGIAAEAGAGAGRRGAQPVYAHLPLLHGPDGKKLSKRHGAASVQELRDAGYLPEAVRNYLTLLGWGDADDETILSTQQLVERFSLERVSRNPAQFDERKLRWLNGRYLRALSVDDLTARLEAFTGRSGLRDAVAISREKMQTLADFWPLAGFIFDGPGRRREGAVEVARRGRPRRAGPRAHRAGDASTRSRWRTRRPRSRASSRRAGEAQAGLPADSGRAGGHRGLARDLRNAQRSRARRGARADRRGTQRDDK